jgi:hypothetical protein
MSIRLHVRRLVLFFLHTDRVARRPVPRVFDDADITFLPRYFCSAGGCIGIWRGTRSEGNARQEENKPCGAWYLFHPASFHLKINVSWLVQLPAPSGLTGMDRIVVHVPVPARVSSTRRFCARPCGVSFGATGSASPRPRAETRFGFTPGRRGIGRRSAPFSARAAGCCPPPAGAARGRSERCPYSRSR